jgi:PPM family protein phosphatase
MKITTSSLSKTGGRKYNEDYCAYLQQEHSWIWVVADGMGGHFGGEIASKEAVEVILNYFRQPISIDTENVNRLLTEANQRILTLQKEKVQLKRMHTTIVLLAGDSNNTVCAHIGDSRCYFFQNGKFISRTQDHSVVQVLVNQGEISEKEMRHHEDRNKVLKSLGKDEDLKPTIRSLDRPMQPGDTWLLCSDGFWEYVYEHEMEIDYFKARTPEEWLSKMETRLMARASNDHDNYTAIAIFCRD